MRTRLQQKIGLSAAAVLLAFAAALPVTVVTGYATSGVSAPVEVSTEGFGQFTEATVASDPSGSQNLFVSSNEGSCWTTLSAQPSFESASGGASGTWSTGQSLPVAAGNGGLDPAPTFDASGVLYDAYLDTPCDYTNHVALDGSLVVAKSNNKGATWASSTQIDAAANRPDKPVMVADTIVGSPFYNRVYVAFDELGNTQPLKIAYNAGSGWTAPVLVDSGNDTGSALAVGPSNGYVYASFWDYTDKKIRTAVSTNGGANWALTSDNVAITTVNTTFPLDNYTGHELADNTSIAIDRSGGSSNGNLYVVWNDKLLQPTVTPSLSPTTGGSLAVGTYQVAYTYVSQQGESASVGASVALSQGQNAIQTGVLTNIPSSITSIRYYLNSVPAGSGLQTGYVASSTVTAGTAPGVLIARGGNGSAPPNGKEHIFFARSTDQGAHWTNPPVRIDTGNRNDAWQPSVAVDQSNGRVTIAWYDRRDDLTNPNKLFLAYYTQSADGGANFLPQQVPVSTTQSDPTVDPARMGTGDYLGMVANGGVAHPVWVETHLVNGTPQMQIWTAAIADAQPLNTWMLQAPDNHPPARTQAYFAFDSVRGNAILFGGVDSGGNLLGDTWTWDGTNWTQRSPATSPSPRASGSMSFDAATGTAVLFGGAINASGGGTTITNETWTWNGTTWAKAKPSKSPSARSGSAMTYYPSTQLILLVGGDNGVSILADAWTWNGSNWSQLRGALPRQRTRASLVFDPVRSVAVLFGGLDFVGATYLNDTWTWNGSSWTQKNPSASPPARSLAGMDYDAFLGQIVLFGGVVDGVTPRGDTWSWDGTTWSDQAPTKSPTARVAPSLAYYPSTRTTLVFGGNTSATQWTGVVGETWTY